MSKKVNYNPLRALAMFWQSRNIVWQLVRREVVGRYRGSFFGLLWSFFQPMLMLGVYTFVFSVVFRARWSTEITNRAEFALILFAGLIVFTFFAECMNRAPTLVVHNSVYVKKVIFPLEILPWVSIGTALFHTFTSFCILLLFQLCFGTELHLTALYFPLILVPLIVFSFGLSWIFASLGVYFRDLGHLMGIAMNVLMFVSPIFYPVELVPEQYRWVLKLNPLTFIIEQTRNVVLFGGAPNWNLFFVALGGSLVIAWLGYTWFQATRRGFADVI